MRLRGEYSEGVTIDPIYVERVLGVPLAQLPLNEDLSAALGITRYEPPIPASMGGVIVGIDADATWYEHDVEQFRLYAGDFMEGEAVIATEKIHGSQGVYYRSASGETYVTSKGFARNRQAILESPGNIYWRAARQTDLFGRIANTADVAGRPVQIFAEVYPCQGANFAYGASTPSLRVYRVFVDGVELSVDQVSERIPALRDVWVPILYRGPYALDTIVGLAAGREQVSGMEANIREGVVVAPAIPRASSEGFPLFLKVINPKYKDSDEFVS